MSTITTAEDKKTKQDFRTVKKSFRQEGILLQLENVLMRARAKMKDDFRELEVVQKIQANLASKSEPIKIIAHGSCDEFNNFWRACSAYAMDDNMEWHILEDKSVPAELMKLMKTLDSVTNNLPIFSMDAEIEVTEAFASVDYGELRSRSSYSPDFLSFVSSMVKTGEEDED